MKKSVLIISALFILLCCAFSEEPFRGKVIQVSSATSGTVTCTDTGDDLILIHDASATTTLTIAFPATPQDGQQLTIVSVGGITTLTMSTGIGTIPLALTTLVAGGKVNYVYNKLNTKWY